MNQQAGFVIVTRHSDEPLESQALVHLPLKPGMSSISYIDGLVQERRNSSALAMELRLSCINPWTWYVKHCPSKWFVAWMKVPCHYLNQCWLVFNWHTRTYINKIYSNANTLKEMHLIMFGKSFCWVLNVWHTCMYWVCPSSVFSWMNCPSGMTICPSSCMMTWTTSPACSAPEGRPPGSMAMPAGRKILAIKH